MVCNIEFAAMTEEVAEVMTEEITDKNDRRMTENIREEMTDKNDR